VLDVVLFDVDGTLVDTNGIIVQAFHETLLDMRGEDVPMAQLRTILGVAGLETTREYTDSEAEAEQMLARWAGRTDELSDQTDLFGGVVDLLTALTGRGLRLGIVTSRLDWELERDVARFGLDRYFDTMVTASDTVRHKPAADPVEEALRRLAAPPEAAVYVGDSVYDMGTAVAAGVPFGLATWGAHDLSRFTQVDVTLEEPGDLLAYVQRRNAGD
jgi:HAD superfamily hydrolase (TIGR01549 family)